MLKESPPLSLEEIRRGLKGRKVEKQTCELDADAARQTLLRHIQQGVKLKPVSVTKSHPEVHVKSLLAVSTDKCANVGIVEF